MWFEWWLLSLILFMKPLCKYIFDHFERDFTFSSIDLSNIPSIDNLVSKICIYFVLLLIWVKTWPPLPAFEFQIIELVANLTTTEFIKSFKRLILRRGKPRVAYSDNAKTFRAGAKWLGNINKDQKLHDFLSRETIIWKFNVPKELWRGC